MSEPMPLSWIIAAIVVERDGLVGSQSSMSWAATGETAQLEKLLRHVVNLRRVADELEELARHAGARKLCNAD